MAESPSISPITKIDSSDVYFDDNKPALVEEAPTAEGLVLSEQITEAIGQELGSSWQTDPRCEEALAVLVRLFTEADQAKAGCLDAQKLSRILHQMYTEAEACRMTYR